MREELDALIGVRWGECNPSAKGITTAATHVIWSPLPVGSRISKCQEIGKVSSTPRSLNATVAMSVRHESRFDWLSQRHRRNETSCFTRSILPGRAVVVTQRCEAPGTM